MAKTEPSADHRTFSSTLWQMFVALRDEGFTESQALELVGRWVAAMAVAQSGQGGAAE